MLPTLFYKQNEKGRLAKSKTKQKKRDGCQRYLRSIQIFKMSKQNTTFFDFKTIKTNTIHQRMRNTFSILKPICFSIRSKVAIYKFVKINL